MKRLGEYELLRKIGAGGMAEVWMGRRAAMAGASKAVAIKLLARNVLDDPDYRQMFLEEARLSMLLTNSNVVQVFDVGEIDGECFMVMEWVDGLNLSELARKMGQRGETLATVVAAHIVGEVLRGLAYAHGLHHDGSKATIVHRDVSPHNVLVSVSGEVKLADFGVARLASEETSGLHVKGKLRYMAPEQLRGRSREPTVDLYAVGAILHELLVGARFRQTRDEADLYSMVLHGDVPPLPETVPAELARLHTGLLEPDPQRRIQSADEALELLYSWPGYRNSSVELARLVRKWIGVEAPRSGILSSELVAAARAGSQASVVASSADTVDAPTRQASGGAAGAARSQPQSAPVPQPRPSPSSTSDEVSMVTAVESGPIPDRAGTETRTAVEVTPETEATAMLTGAPVQRSVLGPMLIVAAVTLALSFGVFGLGFPLGWWGGGQAGASDSTLEADVPVKVAAKAEDPASAQPSFEPELPAKPAEPEQAPVVEDPADAGDADAALGPAGDGDGEGEGEGEGDGDGDGDGSQVAITPEPEADPVADAGDAKPSKRRSPAKPAGPPSDVKFVLAPGYHYAQVKIGSQILSLEPTKTIALAPGSHTVRARSSLDDDWKVAGKITVKSGQSLKVTMLANGKLAAE